MRTTVFATKFIGREVLHYLEKNFPEDLVSVVLDSSDMAVRDDVNLPKGTAVHSWESVKRNPQVLADEQPDLFVLAWWPHLVPEEVFRIPSIGTVNTHNSLLPHGRGVAPNYWAIRNQEPYGVSIHVVEAGIDSGPVLAQTEIPIEWTDTGEILYWRGLRQLTKLFAESYPKIQSLFESAVFQNLTFGSIHSWAETKVAHQLDLDEVLPVRATLNRIRAKEFEGVPRAFFDDDGKRYEVFLQIKEVPSVS